MIPQELFSPCLWWVIFLRSMYFQGIKIERQVLPLTKLNESDVMKVLSEGEIIEISHRSVIPDSPTIIPRIPMEFMQIFREFQK